MFCIQRLKYIALFLSLALIIFSCGKEPVDLVFDNPNDPLSPNYVKNGDNINTGQSQLPSSITGKDGAPMVLIPAGEFQMGSNSGEADERPIHTVYLDAFYMDVYLVTNAQYKKFMDATGHRLPKYWSDPKLNSPDQPVVGVSWYDAVAYCEWVNKRLPTEAEWEKSARGGLVGKMYPWGDSITHDNTNYSGTGGKDIWNGTSPVGSFSPNGYGLYDIVGNVSVYCADWYDPNYYLSSPKNNPTGPSMGDFRVMRGCNWVCPASEIRVSNRETSTPTKYDFSNGGIRCAMDVPK